VRLGLQTVEKYFINVFTILFLFIALLLMSNSGVEIIDR
jgi:hypothetical protein